MASHDEQDVELNLTFGPGRIQYKKKKNFVEKHNHTPDIVLKAWRSPAKAPQ